jgi:2-methylisocitrate lyase-like PEP mutase family enzyme
MGVQDERASQFRRLHESGCFVMPNPWDVGSARVLHRMGFVALATTSAGLSWTLGVPDRHLTLEQSLEHLRAIAGAVDVPVNADFEGGYAVEPDGVARNVGRAVETGVAGLSIEDASGDPSNPLLDFDLAVDRIRAARQAIDDSGSGVVLTGRCESFVVGLSDLDDTVRRLRAYADAGADCLYAPWIDTVEQVATVVEAVDPKPVNLLINKPYITLAQAAALGVRRISVGGMLAKTAWRGALEAAREIADAGTFDCFAQLPDLNSLLES